MRSLTGANYNLGPPQINEESGSNSYKSEDEELEGEQDDLVSSQRDEADQDSILDSVSGDDDDNSNSFEYDSDWSELDCIFTDFEDVCNDLE